MRLLIEHLYSEGALSAAKWLMKKKPGLIFHERSYELSNNE